MWPREKLYRHGENSKLNTEKPDEKNLWSPHKTKFSKNSNCIWLWCFCSVVQQRKDFHIEYILNGENQQLMFFKKLTDGDETHLLTYMGDRRRDVHRPLRLSADSPVNESGAAYFSGFLCFLQCRSTDVLIFPCSHFPKLQDKFQMCQDILTSSFCIPVLAVQNNQ